MVKWYHSLYISEHAHKHEKQIRRQLNSGHASFRQYIITLASNGTDMLDIISGLFLPDSLIRRGLPMVVGIADTKKEAVELVIRMTEDCLEKQGNPDLRAFFSGGER